MSPLWATHRNKMTALYRMNSFCCMRAGVLSFMSDPDYSGIELKIKINVATLHETIHITELFAVLFLSYHFPFRFLLVAYLTFRKLCHDFKGLMFWEWSCNVACLASTLPLLKPPLHLANVYFYCSLCHCNGADGGFRSKSADISWIFLKLSGAESLRQTLVFSDWRFNGIRDLKIRRWWLQRERHKSNRFNNQNNNLHVHHVFFWYISLPSQHDHDVKIPNLTLYRGSTQVTTKFPPSFLLWIWFLGIQL